MFLAVNTGLILVWAAVLAGAELNVGILRALELGKYLGLELFLVLLGLALLSGRTYCYYCPAGTVLSLAGRAAGHCIRTDMNPCIGCGRCNEVCDMQVDVMACAQQGQPVRSLLCVGCGACVDACPVNALAYR